MLRLYNIALLPFRTAVVAWSRRPGRDPASRREWDERRGRGLHEIRPRGVWLHGASVGEARLVHAVATALRQRRPELPLAASCTTPAGRRSLPRPPEVDEAFFGPLDFAGWPARVLDAVRPSAVVLVETELWPNLLAEAATAGVPVVVVNGRLSASRMRRYRSISALLRPSLAGLFAVGARSAADGERFGKLGVPADRVEVTGDLKYDLPPPSVPEAEVRRRLGLPAGRPVVVAGSTGPGEEALILDAFAAARGCHPDLLLVLAPRHLQRVDEVVREVSRRGLAFARASEAEAPPPGVAVRVLDTMGDLAAAYGVATVAFVGGSLVPVGGHNLLEPASAGVPVLFGPHVDSVAETAAALEFAGAARRVGDARELADAVVSLVADESRRREMSRSAEAVIRAHRGALDRSVRMILRAVDATRPASHLGTA